MEGDQGHMADWAWPHKMVAQLHHQLGLSPRDGEGPERLVAEREWSGSWVTEPEVRVFDGATEGREIVRGPGGKGGTGLVGDTAVGGTKEF